MGSNSVAVVESNTASPHVTRSPVPLTIARGRRCGKAGGIRQALSNTQRACSVPVVVSTA